jgi:hypothetical protein
MFTQAAPNGLQNTDRAPEIAQGLRVQDEQALRWDIARDLDAPLSR